MRRLQDIVAAGVAVILMLVVVAQTTLRFAEEHRQLWAPEFAMAQANLVARPLPWLQQLASRWIPAEQLAPRWPSILMVPEKSFPPIFSSGNGDRGPAR